MADEETAAPVAVAEEAAPPPAPPAPPSLADEIAALVEGCFVEFAHGTILSRSTDIYNHAHAFKEELKVRLARRLAQ